jgi:hypothetical protein
VAGLADTLCTLVEVSSAAAATAPTSAFERSAVADMLCAVVCIEPAERCKLSRAVRTVASNVTICASMREARSALAARSLSCSLESARALIMLSRKISSASAIAAISSCCVERWISVSRSPSDNSRIARCSAPIRCRMLAPT